MIFLPSRTLVGFMGDGINFQVVTVAARQGRWCEVIASNNQYQFLNATEARYG